LPRQQRRSPLLPPFRSENGREGVHQLLHHGYQCGYRAWRLANTSVMSQGFPLAM